MRKSHYKSHYATFEELEEATMADFRTRRPLEEEELAVVEILRNFTVGEDELTDEQKAILEVTGMVDMEVELFVKMQEEILAEADRCANYLRPGKKYPLMARNPKRVKAGRRFAYVGIDDEIHIGRRGSVLRVPMKVQ